MMNQSIYESDRLTIKLESFRYETVCDLATASPRFYDFIFTYVTTTGYDSL